jgi:GDP-4-dehydro-6-deoxy-D-mannose reductase
MSGAALITGAEGFVGRRLAAYLAEKGWRVRRSVYPTAGDEAFPCDVRDPAQVAALVEWSGPLTHVFHLAAVTFVPEAGRDPAGAYRANTLGTVHLLEALGRARPDARLVYVSSSEVYGPPRYLPVDEDHPIDPRQPYAISKAASDFHCRYAAAAGRDVVVARPFNHSGAGQDSRFVLSSFARQVAQAEAGDGPAQLRVGNLDAQRDFLHVDDVLHAYERIALEGTTGAAYNICSGRALLLRDAVDTLLRLARREIEVVVDEERLRPLDVPEVRGSHQRLTDDTGWEPAASMGTLLAELLAYWRDRVDREDGEGGG